MFKRILSFSLLFLLAACAGGRVKEIPPDVHDYKRVDFFIQGRTQAAFKVIGQMNQDYLEGVLRIKKIGDQDFDVLLMTGAAYRLLHATVSPQGVAYRYLFKDADTSLVRDRITQFLNLLLSEPGVFQNRRFKDGAVILTYKGRDAKEKFFYLPGGFNMDNLKGINLTLMLAMKRSLTKISESRKLSLEQRQMLDMLNTNKDNVKENNIREIYSWYMRESKKK